MALRNAPTFRARARVRARARFFFNKAKKRARARARIKGYLYRKSYPQKLWISLLLTYRKPA
jgi:hypothetical protein